MAIATEDFKDWGVEEITRLRGKEWYKKGVSKEICEEIFEGCPFGDSQWLSWTKLQSLLREEKREIREDLDPSLEERRLLREAKREEEKEEKRVDAALIACAELSSDMREDKLRNTREHGALKTTFSKEVCFNCGSVIARGKKAVVLKAIFGKPDVLCMECVRIDQEKRAEGKGRKKNISNKVEAQRYSGIVYTPKEAEKEEEQKPTKKGGGWLKW